MTTKVNWALLFAFAVILGANITIPGRPDARNIEILPDMAHSAAYASFSSNSILPDGKTLQGPVPGTLPRGFERLHYQGTPEDALRAAAELKNPLDVNGAQERGAYIYQNFCVQCHGSSMRGDGAVALHGYPAPPNLTGEKSLKLAEGQMFHIVTFGQKNMPSHASQLNVKDRWSVISYIRSRQDTARATAEVQK